MLEHRVQLADGRTLAAGEYGDPASSRVLVTNHGTGSSRLEPAMYDQEFAEMGLRVLTLDRPGYGESSPVPSARLLADWGDDVVQVLDHVGVDRFSVMGYSGGGPHALAIAASGVLRDRTERVILVASLAEGQPERSEQGAETQRRVGEMSWAEFEDWFVSDIMSELANVAPADEEAFADPAFMEGAMATITEGLKQGSLGDASDQWTLFMPWGFALADVAQPVDIWHGDADTVVPIDHAHILVAGLVGPALHVLPAQGHFSIARFLPDIVKVVAAGV